MLKQSSEFTPFVCLFPQVGVFVCQSLVLQLQVDGGEDCVVALQLCNVFVLFVLFLETLVLLKQDALGAGNLILLAGNSGSGHSDGTSNCLEGTLGLVVIILSSKHINMHSNTGTLGETLQDMWDHLGG